MNSLLLDFEGKDEFVITPAPNVYLVTLRITPEEAKEFEGHERLTLCIHLKETGYSDLIYAVTITDDNNPGTRKWHDADLTDAQMPILQGLESRVVVAVEAFYSAVKDDLGEYYEDIIGPYRDMLAIERILSKLQA